MLSMDLLQQQCSNLIGRLQLMAGYNSNNNNSDASKSSGEQHGYVGRI